LNEGDISTRDFRDQQQSSFHNVIRVFPVASIEFPLATLLREHLAKFALLDDRRPIHVVFTSGGGDALEAVACGDAIRLASGILAPGVGVIGVVSGYAFSAASFLLQFCDKRYITKHSLIMVHGLEQQDRQYQDRRRIDANRDLMDKLQDVFAHKIAERSARRDFKFWRDMLDDATPTYYTAEQALELGLVDAVCDDVGFVESTGIPPLSHLSHPPHLPAPQPTTHRHHVRYRRR
jgi:ATP-dependent protease ClpP protease subunit